MQDIYHALGRIESQVHALQVSMHNVQSIIDRLNQRISIIERQYSFWRGGVGILLIISTLFGSIADKLIVSFFKGV